MARCHEGPVTQPPRLGSGLVKSVSDISRLGVSHHKNFKGRLIIVDMPPSLTSHSLPGHLKSVSQDGI